MLFTSMTESHRFVSPRNLTILHFFWAVWKASGWVKVKISPPSRRREGRRTAFCPQRAELRRPDDRLFSTLDESVVLSSKKLSNICWFLLLNVRISCFFCIIRDSKWRFSGFLTNKSMWRSERLLMKRNWQINRSWKAKRNVSTFTLHDCCRTLYKLASVPPLFSFQPTLLMCCWLTIKGTRELLTSQQITVVYPLFCLCLARLRWGRAAARWM